MKINSTREYSEAIYPPPKQERQSQAPSQETLKNKRSRDQSDNDQHSEYPQSKHRRLDKKEEKKKDKKRRRDYECDSDDRTEPQYHKARRKRLEGAKMHLTPALGTVNQTIVVACLPNSETLLPATCGHSDKFPRCCLDFDIQLDYTV